MEPQIAERMLTQIDYVRLTRLASLSEPGASEAIQALLENSELVASAAVPETVITMYTQVLLHGDVGPRPYKVTLCYPDDAEPSQGFISVLSRRFPRRANSRGGPSQWCRRDRDGFAWPHQGGAPDPGQRGQIRAGAFTRLGPDHEMKVEAFEGSRQLVDGALPQQLGAPLAMPQTAITCAEWSRPAESNDSFKFLEIRRRRKALTWVPPVLPSGTRCAKLGHGTRYPWPASSVY